MDGWIGFSLLEISRFYFLRRARKTKKASENFGERKRNRNKLMENYAYNEDESSGIDTHLIDPLA